MHEEDDDDDGGRVTYRTVTFVNSQLTDEDLLSLTDALAVIFRYEGLQRKYNALSLRLTKVTARGFSKLKGIRDFMLDLSGTLVHRDGLIELKYLPNVMFFDLSDTYLSLVALREFVSGRKNDGISLTVSGAKVVNDEVVVPSAVGGSKLPELNVTGLLNILKELKQLKGLDISRLGIRNDDLIDFEFHKKFANLQWVYFSDNELTNKCLSTITSINPNSLWFLALSGNEGIGDAGMDELKKLHRLSSLRLAGTGISDAGLAKLDFSNLQELDISNTRTALDKEFVLDKDNVKKSFKNLKRLYINKTGVTSKELIAIGKLTSDYLLAELNVSDTVVTNKGLEAFIRLRLPTEKHVELAADAEFYLGKQGAQELGIGIGDATQFKLIFDNTRATPGMLSRLQGVAGNTLALNTLALGSPRRTFRK